MPELAMLIYVYVIFLIDQLKVGLFGVFLACRKAVVHSKGVILEECQRVHQFPVAAKVLRSRGGQA